MANFFKSDDVKVYPCSFRGYKTDNTTYNAKARLITEEGFIRPVAVGAVKSYVISSAVDASDEEWLKVVIGGYYFEIKHKEYTGFSHLYIATRSITTNGEEQTVLASLGDNKDSLDSNGYFTGIAYGNSIPAGTIGLQVFQNDGSKTIYSDACLPSYDVGTGTISLNGNKVEKERSAAFGTGTHAEKIDNEFVVGKYNDDEEALFIVGDGAADKKHNSFSTGSSDGTKINENTAITGTLNVSEKTTLKGGLEVNGKTALNDALTANKGVTVSDGGIGVTGDATFKNAIKANSATITTCTTTGTLSVNNAATVGGTLNVTGTTTLQDNLTVADIIGPTKIIGALNVTQTAAIDNVASFNDKIQIGAYTETLSNATESCTKYKSTIDKDGNANFAAQMKADTANITSAATIGTTLNVKGKTTLADKLTVSKGGIKVAGNSSISGALTASSSKDSSTGEYTDNAVIVKSDLLDLIYPIGSIYMIDPIQFQTTPSSSNCPIAKRLGGSWSVIEADFLRCETEAVNNNNLKGGSDNAWLMNHDHSISNITGAVQNAELTDVFYIPRGEYSRWSAAVYAENKVWSLAGTSFGTHITLAGGYSGSTPDAPSGITYNNNTLQEMQLRPNQNHTPVSIKINMSHKHELTISQPAVYSNGNVLPDNSTINRPHYRKVYAWIRTA